MKDKNQMFKDIFDSIKMIVKKELEQTSFSSSIEGIIINKTGNNNTYLIDYKGVEIRAHSFFEEFNPGDNVIILLPEGKINSNNKYILGKTEFRKATEVDFSSFKEEIQQQLGQLHETIENIKSDKNITPNEKQILLENWNTIISDYNRLIEEMKKYNLDTTEITSAYDQYHNFVFNNILNDLTTNTELTDEQNDLWTQLSNTYFQKYIDCETLLIKTTKNNYYIKIIANKSTQVKNNTLFDFNCEAWYNSELQQDDKIIYDWFIDNSKQYTGKIFTYQYILSDNPVRVSVKAYKDNKLIGSSYLDIVSYKDGEDGLPGESSYTHIAYANKSEDGQIIDFSKTDPANKDYIGMYVDNNVMDSDDSSLYTWSLIKGADGAQGIPGKDGINGETAYLHIAYMNTLDNSDDSFSITSSKNKIYMGQYTDHNIEDSNNWQDYKWTKIKGENGEANYLNIITSSGNYNNKKCIVQLKGEDKRVIDKTGSNGIILFEFNENGSFMYATIYDTEKDNSSCEALIHAIDSYGKNRMMLIVAVGKCFISQNLKLKLESLGAKKIQTVNNKNCGYIFLTNKKEHYNYESANFYEDFVVEEEKELEMSIPLGGSMGFLEQGSIGLTGPQGIPGPKGENGQSTYMHIAYADDNEGNGFSESPIGKTYLGVLVNNQQSSSQNPRDYTWSLIKGLDGRDGINGVNGEDGKTYYLHIAYADEISPTYDGFVVDESSNNVTNKKYLGQYIDLTESDSLNPEDYKWTRIKGDAGESYTMSIIGENIFKDNTQHRFTSKIYKNGNLYILGSNPNIFVDWTLNGVKIQSNSLMQENMLLYYKSDLNILDSNTYDKNNVTSSIEGDYNVLTYTTAPLGYLSSKNFFTITSNKTFKCIFKYKIDSLHTGIKPVFWLLGEPRKWYTAEFSNPIRDGEWHEQELSLTVTEDTKKIKFCIGVRGDKTGEKCYFKDVVMKENSQGEVNIGPYGEYIEIDENDFNSNTLLIGEVREENNNE